VLAFSIDDATPPRLLFYLRLFIDSFPADPLGDARKDTYLKEFLGRVAISLLCYPVTPAFFNPNSCCSTWNSLMFLLRKNAADFGGFPF
jgi:hypothetical protein